ncbi:unnamed protein product [Owenia fusiformis]|nr:unnamed protein product [Owenia fusiformis]
MLPVTSPGSTQPFLSAIWSPTAVDPMKRCVFASVTLDHHVRMYSLGVSNCRWKCVCDITQVYYEHINPILSMGSITHSRASKYKQLMEKLCCVDVTWSKLFNEDASKPYCYLSCAMRNGDIVIFKVHTPCLDRNDIEVQTTLHTNKTFPTEVKWCSSNIFPDNLLVIGWADGPIKLIQMDQTKFETSASGNECMGQDQPCAPSIDVWENEDDIGVGHLEWAEQDCLLLALKGNYLICTKLAAEANRAVVIVCQSILQVSDYLPPTRVVYNKGKCYITTVDRSITMYTIESQDNDIQIQKQGDEELASSNPNKTWGIHDVCVSKNQALLVFIESIVTYKDHLAKNPYIKVQLLSRFSQDQCHQLLKEDGDFQSRKDILECLRGHQCSKHTWEYINCPDKDDLEKQSYFLKINRFIVLNELEQLKFECQTRQIIPDVAFQKIEDRMKVLIRDLKNFEKSLHLLFASKYVPKLMQYPSDAISDFGKVTLSRLQSIQGSEEPVLSELCDICQMQIDFTDTGTSVCSNGHPFKRCCLTLSSCQSIRYRLCRTCDAPSINLDKDLEQGMEELLHEKCIFCDDIFVWK